MIAELAREVAAADPGPEPAVPDPDIPVIQVSGTNGKTTTTRLLAHMVMTAGKRVAFSSTDGVYRNDRLVKKGDYSGFGGAGDRPRAASRHRGARDRSGRDPPARDRRAAQRRRGRHERLRRSPRPPGDLDGRPAGRGEGDGHAHHAAGRLGRAERGRSSRAGDAPDGLRSALALLAGSAPPGAPRGAGRSAAARSRVVDGTIVWMQGCRGPSPGRSRPGAGHARRPLPDVHAERARRRRRRPRRGTAAEERVEGPPDLRAGSARRTRGGPTSSPSTAGSWCSTTPTTRPGWMGSWRSSRGCALPVGRSGWRSARPETGPTRSCRGSRFARRSAPTIWRSRSW